VARGSTGSGNGKRGALGLADARLPDMSAYSRLAEYNRKRHFDVTPEPPGVARARNEGQPLKFLVQKHRATALHYERISTSATCPGGCARGDLWAPRPPARSGRASRPCRDLRLSSVS
jgi:hypothetical protein